MREENKNYFKSALCDFAYDVACGAQIRHLTDLGYTAGQIMEELDISVPFGSVQKTVTEHLRATEMLLSDKPGGRSSVKKFVREYDSFGRPSFRQVVAEEPNAEIHWQERIYIPSLDGEFLTFLKRKTEENGESFSYISCDFGLEGEKMKNSLKMLERHRREYIEGILWEKSRMYHRLTPLMAATISQLYEQGVYEGECYFIKTGELIDLRRDHEQTI